MVHVGAVADTGPVPGQRPFGLLVESRVVVVAHRARVLGEQLGRQVEPLGATQEEVVI